MSVAAKTREDTASVKREHKVLIGKHGARVREEVKSREMADLLVLPRPAKSMQKGTGFTGKT